MEAPAPPKGEPLAAPCDASTFDAFLGVGSTFNIATRVVTWGLYAEQLEAIRKLGFEDDALLVIFSEPAMKDADALLKEVTRWLGLPRFDFSKLPTYRAPRGTRCLASTPRRGRVDVAATSPKNARPQVHGRPRPRAA